MLYEVITPSPPDGGEGAEQREAGEVSTHNAGDAPEINPPPHPALSSPRGEERAG